MLVNAHHRFERRPRQRVPGGIPIGLRLFFVDGFFAYS